MEISDIRAPSSCLIKQLYLGHQKIHAWRLCNASTIPHIRRSPLIAPRPTMMQKDVFTDQREVSRMMILRQRTGRCTRTLRVVLPEPAGMSCSPRLTGHFALRQRCIMTILIPGVLTRIGQLIRLCSIRHGLDKQALMIMQRMHHHYHADSLHLRQVIQIMTGRSSGRAKVPHSRENLHHFLRTWKRQ